jgi:hypothetical protein
MPNIHYRYESPLFYAIHALINTIPMLITFVRKKRRVEIERSCYRRISLHVKNRSENRTRVSFCCLYSDRNSKRALQYYLQFYSVYIDQSRKVTPNVGSHITDVVTQTL